MNTTPADFVVFKLGGSLLDLPDLAVRLQDLLNERPNFNHLLVVGGGRAADLVRKWSLIHGLTEEAAHWIAVRSLSMNRALVRHLLPNSREVSSQQSALANSQHDNGPLLIGVEAVLREFEESASRSVCDDTAPSVSPLPHTWDVTSDSISAWIALKWNASELVIVKSIDPPADDYDGESGLTDEVDRHFFRLAPLLPKVSWCNLRKSPVAIHSWLERQNS